MKCVVFVRIMKINLYVDKIRLHIESEIKSKIILLTLVLEF